ncbi:heterokaryon incompatibility [Pestalotiopsis sp. NC0098]|nr:heterokaryon incompatibility [Pestalotiopsis sp. NC0098]
MIFRSNITLCPTYRTFQLGLTTNLHGALTDIRDASREIWIWADAVCIDQHNLDERGHQVGLMGDIYRGAGCTVIYLGSSSPDIEYAFHAIHS